MIKLTALLLSIGLLASGNASATLTDWTDWTDMTGNTALGSIGTVSVELNATTNDTLTPVYSALTSTFTGYANSAFYSPALPTAEEIYLVGQLNGGYDYRVVFGSQVSNPVIYLASLASELTFDAGISITKLSGQDTLTVSGNRVSGATTNTLASPNNDANGIVQLNGAFTSFGFTANWAFSGQTNGTEDGIYLQIGASLPNGGSTNVPEPASLALLSLGLLGVASTRKPRT